MSRANPQAARAADMHIEEQDYPLSKLINIVESELKFGMEIPETMINDAIKDKPKKAVVPRKARTITIANNIVEQETVVVKLAKYVSIEEHRLQQRSKESRREHVRKEVTGSRGEGSSVAQDDNYKFEEFSELESDATRNSSWPDTNKDDDQDDTEDSDMDICNNDFDKADNDAVGFGVFVYNKSQELAKFTPISPIVTCSYMEDFTNFLNDPSEQELTDLLSKPVFTRGGNFRPIG
ncbi:hypothetical protein Tco_0051888 [Tanacetum coccineum]